MASHRIAHLSDLHVGTASDEDLERLVRALLRSDVDRVAITGDLTHRGRSAELERFRRFFAPILEERRAVVVPGNHDRLGDDLEDDLMPGDRVQVSAARGLWSCPPAWSSCGGCATAATWSSTATAMLRPSCGRSPANPRCACTTAGAAPSCRRSASSTWTDPGWTPAGSTPDPRRAPKCSRARCRERLSLGYRRRSSR